MNAKIYNGNVQPNHKEYKIWVDDEGIIKTWNGTEWVENTAGGGSDSNGVNIEYYKVTNDISNTVLSTIITASAILINATQRDSAPTRYIGAGSILYLFGDNSFNIHAFGFNDKTKTMCIANGNVEFIFQGTLQERVDYFTTM